MTHLSGKIIILPTGGKFQLVQGVEHFCTGFGRDAAAKAAVFGCGPSGWGAVAVGVGASIKRPSQSKVEQETLMLCYCRAE